LILKTIDAHVGGQSLRLVVDGFPAPHGAGMLEKREWARSHQDDLRRALMLEPRGHADIAGAVLTEPVSPGAHAGLLFMDGDGYPRMSVHGVAATTAIALERGLILTPDSETAMVYDTPAGVVRAGVTTTASGDRTITVVNVPAFVMMPGVRLTLAPRAILADVAHAGRLYAVVDSEAAGVGMTAAHVADLRRTGARIAKEIDAVFRIKNPIDPGIDELDGVVFTGPALEGQADLTTVVVHSSGRTDRSASGTGMSAVMAVLSAMGLLGDDMPFVAASLIGTRLRARVSGRTSVGGYEAIVVDVETSAWITGEHTFFVDRRDPLGAGFRL
jgi:proline racemase